MTEVQLKSLQRYISAVAYFMLHDAGVTAKEVMAARKHLEDSFGKPLPGNQPRQDFADIL